MIISPVVGTFFAKYKFWLRLLGFVIAAIAIALLWQRFIAEPYREQGRVEIRALWSAEKADLEARHADEITAARHRERYLVAAANALAKQTREELENENDKLQASLDKYRAADRRMRRVRGEVIAADTDGMRSPGSDNARPVQTCEARLPREIGEGFERLRETALRIGSEANGTAHKLNAAQAQLQADREP